MGDQEVRSGDGVNSLTRGTPAVVVGSLDEGRYDFREGRASEAARSQQALQRARAEHPNARRLPGNFAVWAFW